MKIRDFVLFGLGLVVFCSFVVSDSPEEPYVPKLCVVIINQNHEFHVEKAIKMKAFLKSQLQDPWTEENLKITMLYPDLMKEVPYSGWTIVPLAETLIDEFNTSNWFYFVNEFTIINVEKFLDDLKSYDARSKAILMGYAIRDEDPVIIHHFDFGEALDGEGLEYPDESVGILMTRRLLSALVVKEDKPLSMPIPTSIDVPYEVTKLIRGKFSFAVLMKNNSKMCGPHWGDMLKSMNECTVRADWDDWMDNEELPSNEICYGVKTWHMNHVTRLPAIRATWANPKYLKKSRIKYYSDEASEEFGTIAVDQPNSDMGHCAKTLEILNRFYDNDRTYCKWLVLVDDDTFLNTSRLARVLHRYTKDDWLQLDDDKTSGSDGSVLDIAKVAVGQRYGYGHWPYHIADKNNGYDYLTGGAGIAITRTAVESLLEKCSCDIRDPDDMMLGYCLWHLNITMIHNPLFHQASPLAYPWNLIKFKRPVSFHAVDDMGLIDAEAIFDYYLSRDTVKKYNTEDLEPEFSFDNEQMLADDTSDFYTPPLPTDGEEGAPDILFEEEDISSDTGKPIHHEEL